MQAGERDAGAVRERAAQTIAAEPGVRLDYAELVDATTVQPVTRVAGDLVLAVAAYVGPTHLIDNLRIAATDAGVETDLGAVAEEQRP